MIGAIRLPRRHNPARIRRPRLLRLAATWAAIAACPTAGAAALPGALQQAFAHYHVPQTAASVYVKELGHSTAPLIALRDQQPRNPASTMKLVTTLVALDEFSPAYQWTTRALRNGSIIGERLHGDLILQGGGDPYLVTEAFWRLVSAIRRQGIRRIDGNLILDSSRFASATTAAGVLDGKPYRAYNAAPSALLVNFRATEFLITARAGRLTVTADPTSDSLRIDNRLIAVNGPCRGRQSRIGFHVITAAVATTVRFTGRYPVRCGDYRLVRTVQPQNQYVAGLFRRLWTESGGEFSGPIRSAPTPPSAVLLVNMPSRPLAEVMRGINKFSNNVMARQLLLTLGAKRGGLPGTEAKGIAAIHAWLAKNALPAPGLVIDNGAGLSRHARITARSLGRLLEFADHDRYSPEFLASLPLAGLDGTMAHRFNGSPASGRLRIKTGSLNNVRTMAGYVLGDSGRRYVVVMFLEYPGINHGTGTAIQNALLRWLATR